MTTFKYKYLPTTSFYQKHFLLVIHILTTGHKKAYLKNKIGNIPTIINGTVFDNNYDSKKIKKYQSRNILDL